jgi:hypothetical protein
MHTKEKGRRNGALGDGDSNVRELGLLSSLYVWVLFHHPFKAIKEGIRWTNVVFLLVKNNID